MNNLTNFISICENELDLYQKLVIEKKTDPNLTFYKSLPLCIIDAVFSIGVKYTSVMKAEQNFIAHFGLNIPRSYPVANEYSIDNFINDMDSLGSFERAATEVFKNSQKTSSRNGILKAEASYLVAKVFQKHNINTLNEFNNYTNKPALDAEILQIKGQNSGIMLKYLYMLAGDSNLIKPDRHMVRFINKEFPNLTMDAKDHQAIKNIIEQTVLVLSVKYPQLTPRFLDYLIWENMKNKSQSNKSKSNRSKSATP